jgi:hypothetical protein
MSPRRLVFVAVVLAPLLLASAAPCSEPAEPEATTSDGQPGCLRALEWSQRFRAMGELRAARQYLEACMQPGCREVVRTRCAAWLAEVDREIPTVRLVVSGVAPAALLGARASIDGEVVEDGLGAAVAVDPREHTATVLLRDGRMLSSRFSVAASTKNQVVELTPPPLAPVSRAPAPEPEGDNTLGVGLAITGFGLAGAGIIAGAITGAMSIARFDHLSDQCQSSGCTEEEIDEGRALGHASTVSFAVAAGGAAIGVVGVVLLTTNGGSSVQVAWTPRSLSVAARF